VIAALASAAVTVEDPMTNHAVTSTPAIHVEARGPHWVSWVCDETGKPTGSVILVGQTEKEAAARARAWAAMAEPREEERPNRRERRRTRRGSSPRVVLVLVFEVRRIAELQDLAVRVIRQRAVWTLGLERNDGEAPRPSPVGRGDAAARQAFERLELEQPGLANGGHRSQRNRHGLFLLPAATANSRPLCRVRLNIGIPGSSPQSNRCGFHPIRVTFPGNSFLLS
jgi:hypothetical protein